MIGPNLRVLNLAKNVLIPADLLLEAVRGCVQLEEFAMLRPARGSVSGALVTHLLSIKTLRQIYLRYNMCVCMYVDDVYVCVFVIFDVFCFGFVLNPNLRCSGAEWLSDEPFEHMEPMSSRLDVIELAQVAIGSAAVQCIARACPRLRQLNISCNNVALASSHAVEAIGQFGVALRSLNASGSTTVMAPWSDMTVYALLEHSNLLMLKLLNCSYSTLTAEGCVTLLR